MVMLKPYIFKQKFEEHKDTLIGMRFLSGVTKNSKMVVMAVQLCEYTKIHCIVHFKLVHCMTQNYISIKLL